ncbi:KICSTOR complex protein szt2 [Phytophthora boehmeriae]|uniref:KICSTOR complex protein szt2 n=1 Tax=Phytophthora boehmeriae TaxID=109152 RepID=A0A8T1W3P8_9STRA|nr:KICSTOR complex protein szt2 [Phytophthora boehmeriae]
MMEAAAASTHKLTPLSPAAAAVVSAGIGADILKEKLTKSFEAILASVFVPIAGTKYYYFTGNENAVLEDMSAAEYDLHVLMEDSDDGEAESMPNEKGVELTSGSKATSEEDPKSLRSRSVGDDDRVNAHSLSVKSTELGSELVADEGDARGARASRRRGSLGREVPPSVVTSGDENSGGEQPHANMEEDAEFNKEVAVATSSFSVPFFFRFECRVLSSSTRETRASSADLHTPGVVPDSELLRRSASTAAYDDMRKDMVAQAQLTSPSTRHKEFNAFLTSLRNGGHGILNTSNVADVTHIADSFTKVSSGRIALRLVTLTLPNERAFDDAQLSPLMPFDMDNAANQPDKNYALPTLRPNNLSTLHLFQRQVLTRVKKDIKEWSSVEILSVLKSSNEITPATGAMVQRLFDDLPAESVTKAKYPLEFVARSQETPVNPLDLFKRELEKVSVATVTAPVGVPGILLEVFGVSEAGKGLALMRIDIIRNWQVPTEKEDEENGDSIPDIGGPTQRIKYMRDIPGLESLYSKESSRQYSAPLVARCQVWTRGSIHVVELSHVVEAFLDEAIYDYHIEATIKGVQFSDALAVGQNDASSDSTTSREDGTETSGLSGAHGKLPSNVDTLISLFESASTLPSSSVTKLGADLPIAPWDIDNAMAQVRDFLCCLPLHLRPTVYAKSQVPDVYEIISHRDSNNLARDNFRLIMKQTVVCAQSMALLWAFISVKLRHSQLQRGSNDPTSTDPGRIHSSWKKRLECAWGPRFLFPGSTEHWASTIVPNRRQHFLELEVEDDSTTAKKCVAPLPYFCAALEKCWEAFETRSTSHTVGLNLLGKLASLGPNEEMEEPVAKDVAAHLVMSGHLLLHQRFRAAYVERWGAAELIGATEREGDSTNSRLRAQQSCMDLVNLLSYKREFVFDRDECIVPKLYSEHTILSMGAGAGDDVLSIKEQVAANLSSLRLGVASEFFKEFAVHLRTLGFRRLRTLHTGSSSHARAYSGSHGASVPDGETLSGEGFSEYFYHPERTAAEAGGWQADLNSISSDAYPLSIVVLEVKCDHREALIYGFTIRHFQQQLVQWVQEAHDFHANQSEHDQSASNHLNEDDALEAQLFTRELFRVASQHYERDLLWSRLLFDYTRGPGPEVARTLALPTDVFRVEVGPQQLEECLRLSICTPLETLDPRLDELLRVSGVCWQELALRLRDIYSDQLREFQFQEDDENSSHLLLLCPDTFDLVIHLCFVTPKNQVDRDAPAEDGGSSGSADSSPDSASMNGSHAGSFNGEFSDDGFDVETQGDVRVEICRREEPPNKQFTFAQRRSITEFVNSIVHWQWRSLIYD